MTKISQSMVDLYRIALKNGDNIESFYEGDSVHIWTREAKRGNYEKLWIVLSPNNIEVIEKDINLVITSVDLVIAPTTLL